MRSARWSGIWFLVGAGVGGVTLGADEKAGDPALTSKGLTKQGAMYVLVEREKPVLAKLREARGAFRAMAAASSERAGGRQLADRAEDLEQRRSLLQSQLDALTQQIALQPPAASQGGPGGRGGPGGAGGFGSVGGGLGSGGGAANLAAQREQVRQQLVQVLDEQRVLKAQAPKAKEGDVLDQKAKNAEDRFRSTLADLRQQVDAVQAKYGELEADDSVKKALTEARKANVRVRLGPSAAFVAATRELDKAERQYFDKPTVATARKKATPRTKQ